MHPPAPQTPRVFISYAQESDALAEQVWQLACALRHDGIDAELDQLHVQPRSRS